MNELDRLKAVHANALMDCDQDAIDAAFKALAAYIAQQELGDVHPEADITIDGPDLTQEAPQPPSHDAGFLPAKED